MQTGDLTIGLIVDGCRTHVGKSDQPTERTPAPMPPPIINGYMAFATKPGHEALPKYPTSQTNMSAYTEALVENFHKCRDINALLGAICKQVATMSGGYQLPWYSESLRIDGEYSLRSPPVAAPVVAAPVAVVPPVEGVVAGNNAATAGEPGAPNIGGESVAPA